MSISPRSLATSTARQRPALTWVQHPHPNAQLAYSGSLDIGFIGKADDGWYWQITAVFMKHIGRRQSGRRLASCANAKAALRRAWSSWRKAAAL
jgi:hypothetical protein